MSQAPAAVFYDLLPPPHSMLAEVLEGLGQRQKRIEPKYFYDARGCQLFEAICDLPEYYPTRTELSIMQANASEMAQTLGDDCTLIEIGCGNSEKTKLLLKALRPRMFVPIDIAKEQLATSCNDLAAAFPEMSIVALRADFAEPLKLPAALSQTPRRILYLPGSTIGNFTPSQARLFLARWRPMLGRGGGALLGVDLKKDPAVLNAAYNDSKGVTAEFNLNVLTRFNRELGANFNERLFRHQAYYEAELGRIEMHLVSVAPQHVTVDGQAFTFTAQETIHTENSYKYSVAEFQELGRTAGFVAAKSWIDPNHLFAVHYFATPD